MAARSRLLLWLAGVVLALVVAGVVWGVSRGGTSDPESVDAVVGARERPEPTEVILQTDEEALEEDMKKVAEAHGWTVDEARALYETGEVLGDIAAEIAEQRPDMYVGFALGENPGDPPVLYIKGPSDEFVRDLVRASGIDMIVVDNQPHSFAELEERHDRVHEALAEMGFKNITSGPDAAGGGTIWAVVTERPGVTENVADILAGLPADLRDGVELTIRPRELADDFGGGDDWGPLAVQQTTGDHDGDDARFGGVLRIADQCVFIEGGTGTWLVVWPSSETRWRSDTRDIEYRGSDGDVVVGDGDQVLVGGGGSNFLTDQSRQDMVALVDWAAEPNPECFTDSIWFIDDLTLDG